MPTQVQTRRGTTAQHSTFTGAAGELTVDTDKKTVVVHDASTAGGLALLREDGSNSALALGSASAPSLKFTGDTNTGVFSPGADRWAVTTGGSQRVEVDASGRVLVGTSTSPSVGYGQYARVVIQGYIGNNNEDGALALQRGEAAANITAGENIGRISFNDNAGNSFADIGVQADGAAGSGDYPGRLVFSVTRDGQSSPSEALRIDSNGTTKAKGSTTTNAASALQAVNSADTLLFSTRNDGAIFTGLAASSPFNLTTANPSNVVVESNGFLYRSTSSLKYKKEVGTATHGLAELLQLRPVTYKGIGESDGEKVFGGLIAEEVHEVGLTEFVLYSSDGQPDALAYSNMVSLCIKAIQEQQAMIAELQTKVAALEAA